MSIDNLNNEVARMGGTWVKLRTTADAPVEGEILDFVERDRTDPEGNTVYKRGTQTPRVEWVFTLQTDQRDPGNAEDDGIRKVPCNESMQRAIKVAIRESGGSAAIGGTLKIGVKSDPESDYSQAEYQARYTPPAKAIAVDVEDF